MWDSVGMGSRSKPKNDYQWDSSVSLASAINETIVDWYDRSHSLPSVAQVLKELKNDIDPKKWNNDLSILKEKIKEGIEKVRKRI